MTKNKYTEGDINFIDNMAVMALSGLVTALFSDTQKMIHMIEEAQKEKTTIESMLSEKAYFIGIAMLKQKQKLFEPTNLNKKDKKS